MVWYKNKLIASILIILILTGLISFVATTKFLNSYQLQLADHLYSKNNPSPEITVVLLDEKTLKALGDYENWNRSNFAKVIENINKYQPKVVGLDFYFRIQKDEEGDAALTNALKQGSNDIIGFFAKLHYDPLKQFFVEDEDNTNNPLPYQDFQDSATVSFLYGNNDGDEVRRRLPPLVFREQENKFYENLPFAIARKALGYKALYTNPQIDSNKYIFGDASKTIPLEDGRMLINYQSNYLMDSFQEVSFVDVYNENFQSYNKTPEQLFKDKIILIGPSALYFKDLFPTPKDKKVLMPGVEIHANAVQTIIENKFLRNLATPEQIILIALFTILSVFVFMYTKIRYSLILLAVLPLLYGFAAQPAFDHGLILDLIHPYIALTTSFIGSYLYRYLTEFREKNALKNAFSRYVNPHLAQQIMAHPENLKLGGESREVSVLFTDIAHFTSISEQLSPTSLVAVLNEYFQAMSEVILAEGGTLDKFEGDAIMAFFGAPLSQADHALRACRTALLMRQKLAILNEKWKNDPPLPGGEPKPFLDFRTGINTTNAIVGNLGSKERFDYTVIGDGVNLASRLEGTNKKYATHLMMSEMTYNQVKSQVEAREIDIIRVVGKKEPIKVYELLAFQGQLHPSITELLKTYNEGIELYHKREFTKALVIFTNILAKYPDDGPSKLFYQRCSVLKDFPPAPEWDGVFEMGSK